MGFFWTWSARETGKDLEIDLPKRQAVAEAFKEGQYAERKIRNNVSGTFSSLVRLGQTGIAII